MKEKHVETETYRDRGGGFFIVITCSGFPMVLATALLRSLRASEVDTPSKGTFVLIFKVGILCRAAEDNTDTERQRNSEK